MNEIAPLQQKINGLETKIDEIKTLLTQLAAKKSN
jgi:hypothetical protein